MSLILHSDNWMRFGAGRKWRCAAPRYLCEVDQPGNTPNYSRISSTLVKVRRIKSFYAGRLQMGLLDQMGTGLDILVANALAESFGTELDAVIRYVATRAAYLERREPGYVDPLTTPGRVSVGAHHVLISTARTLTGARSADPEARISQTAELVCRIPAESRYAAQIAIDYFNRSYSKHMNQPPLLAATYNAGSPRPYPGNAWNLRQYGNHLDRWVAYYNTSRMA